MKTHVLEEVRELMNKFRRDVELRKELGDSNAEYHSREPKIRAYKLLLDEGLTPKEAVELANKT